MRNGTFCTHCEAIYGVNWKTSQVARDLGRDIRTIRRWKSSESPVPKVVIDWLEERIKHLAHESVE